jgi:hypothetical protein
MILPLISKLMVVYYDGRFNLVAGCAVNSFLAVKEENPVISVMKISPLSKTLRQ